MRQSIIVNPLFSHKIKFYCCSHVLWNQLTLQITAVSDFNCGDKEKNKKWKKKNIFLLPDKTRFYKENQHIKNMFMLNSCGN